MSIYTRRFYTGIPSNGTTIYTVPSGKVAVLTNLDVRNGSATAGIFGLTSAGVLSIVCPSLGLNIGYHLTTRLELDAGDTIVAVVTAGAMSVQLTGYLFDA